MGFVIFVTYSIRSGYPLSTFLDFAALGVQSVVLLVLASFYCKKVEPVLVLPVAGLFAATLSPAAALEKLQLGSAAITTLALLPQIVSNFRARSRGGWSPVSAALSTIGNTIRCFTTITLANANPLLLFQFTMGALLNALLLVQSLIWY